MQGHAETGAEILHSIATRVPGVGFVKLAEEIARGHHERYDGRGYPRGIGGRDIPFPARIAAVADVYDALTSNRVYKDAITHGEALELLRQGAGSQFDPLVIDAFLECESKFAGVAAELADAHPTDQASQLVTAQPVS